MAITTETVKETVTIHLEDFCPYLGRESNAGSIELDPNKASEVSGNCAVGGSSVNVVVDQDAPPMLHLSVGCGGCSLCSGFSKVTSRKVS